MIDELPPSYFEFAKKLDEVANIHEIEGDAAMTDADTDAEVAGYDERADHQFDWCRVITVKDFEILPDYEAQHFEKDRTLQWIAIETNEDGCDTLLGYGRSRGRAVACVSAASAGIDYSGYSSHPHCSVCLARMKK